MARDQDLFAYIGCWDMYKSGTGNGFGVCRYDPDTAELQLLHSALPQITVGAATLAASGDVLYCTDERATLPGYFRGGGGLIYAIEIDKRSGRLREINHQPSFGSLPSHLSLDATGEYLVVTHHTGREPVTKVCGSAAGEYRISLEYDDATTVLFPIRADGSIAAPADVHRHSGGGGPLPRQTHPQLHSVAVSPCGSLFAVCDKGNDEIVIFRIDRRTSRLEVCGGGVFKSIPGSSPRYSAFHPTHPYLFVNHETRAIVSSLRYGRDGSLELLCTASSLPDDREDNFEMKQSDLAVHPSGKFLYSLIRGINAVCVFKVREENGRIERTQTAVIEGTGPRGCAISPDGRFLLIAALTSNEVLTWSIGSDGSLEPTGNALRIANPGSITFGRRGYPQSSRTQPPAPRAYIQP